MGYKLAGFDVLGCNEIDPKMIEAYKANHNPKYAYLEPIQTFKLRDDLPEELYNLIFWMVHRLAVAFQWLEIEKRTGAKKRNLEKGKQNKY
jgi:site-specific DNA-cytosine methylase